MSWKTPRTEICHNWSGWTRQPSRLRTTEHEVHWHWSEKTHFGVSSCENLHKALIESSESNGCLSVVGDATGLRWCH
jgi:hypothetical protein